MTSLPFDWHRPGKSWPVQSMKVSLMATIGERIAEKAFAALGYEPFADWLVNEMEECTR